ncbi:MAG: hypothetical protein WC869_12720 [Phycisphaerae bacterium]|jgi:hypothetical protein
MHPGKRSFAILATLIMATIAVLGWQHRQSNGLREAIAQQRTLAREQADLQAENRRLVAAQMTEAELEDLVARRMAAEQLRTQLATMHRREEASTRAAAADARTAVPSLKGNSLAFQLWQNAGQASPDAAFQTTLWAAAAGDLDSLAGLLEFDAAARSAAAAAFDRLPGAVQNELGTPERLIALLTAMDVPLGRAAILREFPTPTDTKVAAQLIDAEGKSKTAVFSLRTDGDRWRLVVPAEVVKKYAGWLQAPPQ